ncbi:MAG: hypothetical protein FJ012_07920 [Chloroflexi bacterium]|nr:hypothetical protein [Chloroflexota bacterium]
MGELFTTERLDRIVNEMSKRQFPADISGYFTWGVSRDKDKLVFSHPHWEGLVVEVSNLEALGEQGLELRYRSSFYAGQVTVNLPAHLTWPDVVPGEYEDVTLYPGGPYEQKGKRPKMERRPVRNQARVLLGSANSRRKVLSHVDSKFEGAVSSLLSGLDKLLATLYWEADKVSTGKRVDWRPAGTRENF